MPKKGRVYVGAALALLLCAAAPPDAEIKRGVAARMLDPGSVQFRATRMVPRTDGRVAMLGELNAKNAMGGYAGFRRFCAVLTRMPDGPRVMLATDRDMTAEDLASTCSR